MSGPASIPFDGTVLQQAAALASVGPRRLPELLGRVDAALRDRRESIRRRFERVHSDESRELFLAREDHLAELGAELGLEEREWQAVGRAHESQLLRIGSEQDRREEFEPALEIRSAVVVGRE